MSIQRYTTGSGSVRYRARIKFHSREVATRVFERRRDAEAWEREQKRRLHLGEWFDPRRGRVPLEEVAEEWLAARSAVKRRTRETDESTWRLHVEPRFGDRPVASITTAEVEQWVGSLVRRALRVERQPLSGDAALGAQPRRTGQPHHREPCRVRTAAP
ncbi:MAG: hypothetical protein J7518_09440 [Nocardioidaceae bacterium]|nr:hypothetical protein [Nocardioidaceae bacterium]